MLLNNGKGGFMATRLIEVPGIGPKTAEYLEGEGLASAEDLVQAGMDELIKAPGFHLNRATSVLDAARALIGETGAETPASDRKVEKVLTPETGKAKEKKKQKKEKKGKKDKDKNAKKKKDKKSKKKKKKS
jgi:endonuclease III